VYWTLAYEWMFYVALPFLALFSRGRASLLLFAAVLMFGGQGAIVFNFLSGMLAAVLIHSRTLEGRRLDSPWMAPLPVAALAGFFVLKGLPPLAYAALLFVFFVFVVHGQSLFGLLRSRPAKVLGLVSYSIYLIHCIVLYVVVRALDQLVPVGLVDLLLYWLVVALAAAATVVLSAFSFRCIEYPFINPKGMPRWRFAMPAWIPVPQWKTIPIRS
jgi:peptidoglycan/LPS O-acetylase OafA/YrhL